MYFSQVFYFYKIGLFFQILTSQTWSCAHGGPGGRGGVPSPTLLPRWPAVVGRAAVALAAYSRVDAAKETPVSANNKMLTVCAVSASATQLRSDLSENDKRVSLNLSDKLRPLLGTPSSVASARGPCASQAGPEHVEGRREETESRDWPKAVGLQQGQFSAPSTRPPWPPTGTGRPQVPFTPESLSPSSIVPALTSPPGTAASLSLPSLETYHLAHSRA